LCRNPSTHTYCQILCFYLDPLLSNGWKQCEWPFKWQNWQGACVLSRDGMTRGHPKPHIWNQRPKFAYSLYNFYEATTTIKGNLHGCTPL